MRTGVLFFWYEPCCSGDRIRALTRSRFAPGQLHPRGAAEDGRDKLGHEDVEALAPQGRCKRRGEEATTPHRAAKGWWGRRDSNLRSHEAADLQSAPFATRDTPRSTAAQSGRTLPADRRRPWNAEGRDSPDEGRDRARLWAKRWGKVNRGEQLKSPSKPAKLPYSGTRDTSEPMKDRKFTPRAPAAGLSPSTGREIGRPTGLARPRSGLPTAPSSSMAGTPSPWRSRTRTGGSAS